MKSLGKDSHEVTAAGGVPDAVEQEIRLEDARRARVEAELRQEKQKQKEQRSERRREYIKDVAGSKKRQKRLILVPLIAAALLVVVFTVVLPLAKGRPQTQYFATSTLEDIVRTSHLSTIECVYKGIAEKEAQYIFGFQTDSGYRVKYTARVKYGFDFSQVMLDEEKNDIVVYLPEPTLNDPVIEEDSLGFIPEGYSGDLGEILRLCKDDAALELKEDDSLREMAKDNMKMTVRALVEPLVGDDYELVFRDLLELEGEA